MDKIYIVEGSTGEYSDHCEWVVAAYRDEDAATLHVAASEQWTRDHGANCLCPSVTYNKWPADSHNKRPMNPHDPAMRVDYTGVRYYMYVVNVFQSYDEWHAAAHASVASK